VNDLALVSRAHKKSRSGKWDIRDVQPKDSVKTRSAKLHFYLELGCFRAWEAELSRGLSRRLRPTAKLAFNAEAEQQNIY
jgi:hypothetical protein